MNRQKFLDKAIEKYGDKIAFQPLPEDVKWETKYDATCKFHGDFQITPKKLFNTKRGKYGCPKCSFEARANKRKLTTEEFIKKAKTIHGDEYDYTKTKYGNNQKDKVIITCKLHGDFLQASGHHLTGRGCPKCRYIKSAMAITYSKEEFVLKANEVHNDFYDYTNMNYSGSNTKIEIDCPKHGPFSQNAKSHLQGKGCPKCANYGPSSQEHEVLEFIESFYPHEIIQSDRKIIHPKELDIVLPHSKIAIEYNGLFWHSEFNISDKNYHLQKTKDCQEAGYRLIHIFEDEWRDRKEQVKSKIKSILGCDDRDRIYARKCTIWPVTDKKSIKKFLEKYHIQGHQNGSIVNGLFYQNKLVALMVFKRRSPGVFELTRYATSHHVIGGFSRLLEHFKRDNEWSEIISFADIRWHDGHTYVSCGFNKVKETRPDYRYIVNGNRIHKFLFRHTTGLRKLPTYDPSLTEKENMQIAGIPRIYDCGLIKYNIINQE